MRERLGGVALRDEFKRVAMAQYSKEAYLLFGTSPELQIVHRMQALLHSSVIRGELDAFVSQWSKYYLEGTDGGDASARMHYWNMAKISRTALTYTQRLNLLDFLDPTLDEWGVEIWTNSLLT
jgi:hypothetical protein